MSEFDIMPYRSVNGGHTQIGSGRVDATATYLRGEPVEFDTDGSIIEATDEPSFFNDTDNDGTPAEIGSKVIGVAMAGAAATGTGFATDGLQATAETEGVQMPFSEFHKGDEYIVPAARFTEANDTTFDGTVAASNVGDLASLRTAGGIWGLCINTSSNNRGLQIVKLLDVDGQDAVALSTTITQIVVKVL